MTGLLTALGIASISRGRLRIRRKWWALKREYHHIHSACIRFLKKKRII